jgi:hypothetical protein
MSSASALLRRSREPVGTEPHVMDFMDGILCAGLLELKWNLLHLHLLEMINYEPSRQPLAAG